MPKNVTDILTKAELDLLQEVIDSQEDDASHNVFISHVSTQMLNVLAQSDDIVLVMQNQQEEFRFPLYLIRDGYSDELKELGPPDIIDHGILAGLEGRYWRLEDPDGVQIFDLQGENLLGSVMNISTSGLYIQCDRAQFQLIDQHCDSGDTLAFYLKVPNRGFHLVKAKIVRVETAFSQHKGLALNFEIDDKVALMLHSYIMEKHELIESSNN